MQADKTSIIIPCFFATEDHVEMTKDCLSTLADCGRPDQVIVVDDGSPIHPELEADVYLTKPTNTGFPQTVNLGLSHATGGILIVSNNDILFTPGWLEALVFPLQNGYDISSIRTTDQGDWTTEDKITEGDKFGSLWAMKRVVYDQLGGFDERYGRGYFEDLDYRRQAISAGFRIAKNHAGIVEHRGRATFDTLDPRHELYEKNKQVFTDKWGFLE